AADVAADKIEYARGDIEHGVVIVDGDGIAVQRSELGHRDLFIAETVVIRAFPPAVRLGIDIVAIYVDVRNALSEAHSSGLQVAKRRLHGIENLVLEGRRRSGRGGRARGWGLLRPAATGNRRTMHA